MENNKTSKRIHPLVAGAAVAIMLVSLTGVAAMTGLLPSSHGTAAPTAALADKPEAASQNDAGKSTAADQQAPATQHNVHSENRSPVQANGGSKHAQTSTACHSCGQVESVQAVEHAAKPSGVGVVAGALLGGVLGNQVGSGNGRKLATVAGAVGGGYAGNEVEKRTHSTTSYQVRVRMEDGSVRSFPYAQQPGWSTGDRVKVIDGQLTARG